MTGLRCEYSQAEDLVTCSSLKVSEEKKIVNEDFLAPLKECPNFLEEFNLKSLSMNLRLSRPQKIRSPGFEFCLYYSASDPGKFAY